MLIDNHGRTINYLRLAVTDRCNLRCQYCMPEKGLDWAAAHHLLSIDEMMRLLRICSSLGITKLRYTGGEPFLRKDFPLLMKMVAEEQLFSSVSITTNGVLTASYLDEMIACGIEQINLSLDTLDSERFAQITRRDNFDHVMKTLELLEQSPIKVKINAVIMDGVNDQDIASLVHYTRDHATDVRFIEEMPFNGHGHFHGIRWNWKAIMDEVKEHFPSLEKIEDSPNSTSLNYTIAGHLGKVGVIPAYTRSFCGTCNRLRITAKGTLKTCLYSADGFSLKEALALHDDQAIAEIIRREVSYKAVDGIAASSQTISPSMAEIGG